MCIELVLHERKREAFGRENRCVVSWSHQVEWPGKSVTGCDSTPPSHMHNAHPLMAVHYILYESMNDVNQMKSTSERVERINACMDCIKDLLRDRSKKSSCCG